METAKTQMTRLFDLTATPNVDKGFIIQKHIGHGFVELMVGIELFMSTAQKQDGCTIKKIEPEIQRMTLLNASVLDFLLANPELIPKAWKKITVLFVGTEYATEDGEYIFVRCLYWSGANWCSSKHQVSSIVNTNTYIAVTNTAA